MADIRTPEPFVQFKNMRDILAELEESRFSEIATRVVDLIRASSSAGRQKADGLLAYDKKDGGKDCGTDGKEGKEESDTKETCDPDGSELIYGDPTVVTPSLLGAAVARQTARLQALLSGASPII